MIVTVLLISIVAGPMFLLWLFMSRLSGVRWTVGAVLASLSVLGGLLALWQPRAVWEILIAVVVLGSSSVITGRWTERRRVGRAPVRWSANLFAGWLLIVLCGLGVLLRPGPFVPATDLVLPLPDCLTATPSSSEEGICGSGSCTRTITVTGRPGQSGADLLSEVRAHLQVRGLPDQACRPMGWLLDTSATCVELSTSDTAVTIALSGARSAPGR